MRKFGLAAILTFVDKGATAAMGRIGRRAALLKKQFQGVGAGMRQMRGGMAAMAMAALPVAAGFGLMMKKGADFQQAVANLRAVTLDTANRTTPALKSLAKTLGATTVFSASQAADSMTELARAGLSTKQIMGAVRGTLAAAAAEGVDLAVAAKMVSSNMKAFNLDASQAAKIAGILALTSARTNTNMTELQEGLKLGAPAVKPLNVSLADTAALLGSLADIGLKGTLGGTAIRSSVAKLLKPTKDSKKALATLGITIADMRKKMDKGDLVGVFQEVVFAMKKIPSASKRAELMSRIFGIRGQTMTAAMNMSNEATFRFAETLEKLRNETGETATAMAKLKLNTVLGQVKLLTSAFEGFSIELFDLVAGSTKGFVVSFAQSLGDLVLAMRISAGEKIVDPKARERIGKISLSVFEVARGIREAFGEVRQIFVSVGETLGGLGRMFGLTGDGSSKSIAKIVTKVVLLTAAFAPLALVIGGVGRLFGGLASTAIGALRVVTGVLGGIFKGGRGLFGKLGKGGALGEMATAQPVRVVNFHEMGAASALTGKGDFIGPLQRSRLRKFGDRINSVSSRLGRFGLLGAVAALGVGVGTLIDRWTGASTKISNAAVEFTRTLMNKAIAPIRAQQATLRQTVAAAETLNQLIGFSKRGMKVEGAGGKREVVTRESARARLIATLGRQELNQKQIATVLARVAPLLAKLPTAGAGGAGTKPPPRAAKDAMVSAGGLLPVSAGDVVIDRASLASAVVSQMRGGLAGAAGAGALGGGDPGRTSPAPAASSGPIRIEVPIEIDGRQVAYAIAEVQLDELERGGSSMSPGDRRSLFERGVPEGGRA